MDVLVSDGEACRPYHRLGVVVFRQHCSYSAAPILPLTWQLQHLATDFSNSVWPWRYSYMISYSLVRSSGFRTALQDCESDLIMHCMVLILRNWISFNEISLSHRPKWYTCVLCVWGCVLLPHRKDNACTSLTQNESCISISRTVPTCHKNACCVSVERNCATSFHCGSITYCTTVILYCRPFKILVCFYSPSGAVLFLKIKLVLFRRLYNIDFSLMVLTHYAY